MEIEFDFKNALVSKKELKELSKKCQGELDIIKYPVMRAKKDPRSCLLLPEDLQILDQVKNLAFEKKKLHPEIIIVIGIGGSNLGEMAVAEGVTDRFKSHLEGSPKVMYADSVDSESMNFISKTLELELAKGKNVLLNVISKSGSTLETIANFEVLINIIQTYKENYKEHIVIISDNDSALANYANEQKISFLEIPIEIGGRYSVFSAGGLFTLAMIGIKIEEFFKGAREMYKICLESDVSKNPAMTSAIAQYYHYKKKANISNLFLFSKNLETLGKWHRQLMAESLGKEKDLKGKKVNVGITPIVSIGTIDLHSMEQLCIAGPYDKFTTFVSVKEQKSEISLPLVSKTGLGNYLSGYNFNQLSHYILEGVKENFQKKKRPFISLEMPDISENSIGQFMMWKMFETIFLAKLLNVNAFDQPAVESYKKATRDIMAKNRPN